MITRYFLLTSQQTKNTEAISKRQKRYVSLTKRKGFVGNPFFLCILPHKTFGWIIKLLTVSYIFLFVFLFLGSHIFGTWDRSSIEFQLCINFITYESFHQFLDQISTIKGIEHFYVRTLKWILIVREIFNVMTLNVDDFNENIFLWKIFLFAKTYAFIFFNQN